MADVKRNLEAGGGLFLSKFWTGLYENRSPLFTPISALGIQLIARQDVLWDGVNTQITPQFTLRRRYGFKKACTVALASGDRPLDYFSFENLAGDIIPIVDTLTDVFKITPTALTSIYTKTTTAQSSFNSVADTLYWCDGKVAKKYGTVNGISNMGIASPATAPTLEFLVNGILNPLIGYKYGYCFKNPTTDHPSTMSPASASTGPLNNQTEVENRVTVDVTSTAISGNVLTVVCGNNFQPGQSCSFLTLGHATWLNGHSVTVVTSSSTQITAAFTHSDYTTAAETQGTITMTVAAPTSSPYEYTVVNADTFLGDGGVMYASNSVPLTVVDSSPAEGQYSVSDGVYTFSSADGARPMDITYSFSLGLSTGITIEVSGDGSADTQASEIEIYRTQDGGSQYNFLATVANPGAGNQWTYDDSTLDSGLNTDIIAPIANVNDPPPAGMSLLTWYGGRLWGAVKNTLYFSAGPDCVNGNGQESWPPGNNYTLPGNVSALAGTSQGLIIWVKDDAYVTTGTTSATFTVPQIWQTNFGVANQNCVAQDGDNLIIFTMRSQLYSYGTNGLAEIGFSEEKQLGAMTPADVYVALHRSGEDEGVFISDGLSKIYRYSQTSNSWDPPIVPVGGVGCIASIELTSADWRLMMGRPTGAGYILERDTDTWDDDDSPYPAWTVIGSITVAPPRQVANIASVLTQLTAVGSYPTISVLLNEVKDLGKMPAMFVTLPNPVPDPPQLPPSQSLWVRRHDFKAAQTPLSGHVSHLQIKVDFGTEAQPNELLGIGLA